jgi:peptide/nickel transport system substrate-binding protein
MTPAALRSFYRTLPTYPFSLDAARAELRKSGHATGFTAELDLGASGGPTDIGLAMQTFAANLEQIGIKLNVTQKTTSGNWFNHTIDFTAGNWNGWDFPDPLDLFENWYWSKNAYLNGPNFARYKNPVMDRLIVQAQRSSDPAVRRKAFARMNQIALGDLPYSTLWYGYEYVAVRAPFSYHDYSVLWYFTPWWLEGIKVT